jgi:hypothetical protein
VGHKALYGVAALVKTFEENGPSNFDQAVSGTNPNILKGREGELQMVIMTRAIDSVFDDPLEYTPQAVSALTLPNGMGEGDVAVDRYRCIGRPLEHQKMLATFLTATSLFEDVDTGSRSPKAAIFHVGPSRIDPGQAVTVRGRGLLVRKSATTGRGAELFIRDRAQGPATDWTNITANVVSSTDNVITFQWPTTSSESSYELMVRTGDGQIVVHDSLITVDTSVVDDSMVQYVENFMSRDLGKFPSGWSANVPNALRVIGGTAQVGSRSGRFRGTGRSATDLAHLDIDASSVNYGSDDITFGFSFRLHSSVIASGNTITLKAQGRVGSTYYDLFGITLNTASSLFGAVLYQDLSGVADATTLSSVPLDTAWHDINLVVTSAGSTQIYLDGTQVGSTLTSSGTAFTSNAYPARFVIDNTATSTTSVNVGVDAIYVRTD